MIFKPTVFRLIVLNKTTDIMHARAHLKPVTHAKQFYGIEITQMHNKYAF